MFAEIIPNFPLTAETGVVGLLASIISVVITAIFVKRYGIRQTSVKDERQQLSEDTQYIIDTLSTRYAHMEDRYTKRVADLLDRIENMAIQLAAALASKGDLVSQLAIEQSRRQTLEEQLAAMRERLIRAGVDDEE